MTDTIRCFNCSKNIPAEVEKCPVCGFAVSGAKIEAIKEATDLNTRAQLLETKGEHEEAASLYRKAVELYPEFVVAHYNLGIALGRLNKNQEAEVSLSEAINLKPDFAAAYTARGDVYTASSDYEAAVKDYSKALELYPDYAQAYKKRAQAWIEVGGREEAAKDLEDYLFYKPHDARARRRLEKLKEGVG
jgi:tetratricopeptide (TPR) repeat protein